MIRLEFLESENYKKLVEWNKNKSKDFLYQWSGPWYKYPLTEKQIEDRVKNKANKPDSSLYIYKIILEATKEMIGTIELFKVDRIAGTAVAGKFLIDESQRGRGFGKQVLNELLKIGFNKLELKTININVFDFNVGAIKCYESVGFVKKNFIEKVWEAETGFWNLYEMSINKEDY
jgi:RimJ/RimL family protein N-acetyltransferase